MMKINDDENNDYNNNLNILYDNGIVLTAD
jgi:hypothetical protein